VRRGKPGRPDAFFDRFREAIARLPQGLIRVLPPAAPEHVAAAEVALGRTLPQPFADFLRSFDGADLFHESILVAGVGPRAPLALSGLAQAGSAELAFAVSSDGDTFALDPEGRVRRTGAGSDERALAGSSFSRWLEAVVARDQILYGADGEYAEDVFDPGGDVTPLVGLRQAERALRADPGSADAQHAKGLALARLDRWPQAIAALESAVALDPDNPWPWFDLGRVQLETGRASAAVSAFRRAAELEPGASGARLYAWAARAARAAADTSLADELRAAALARDPDLVATLERAATASAADGDAEAEVEAVALFASVTAAELGPPGRPPRVRLTVLAEPIAPPPPRAARRRPARETPPRPGGRRRES
jgi:tetratricopeptide (TPR) repeat protein